MRCGIIPYKGYNLSQCVDYGYSPAIGAFNMIEKLYTWVHLSFCCQAHTVSPLRTCRPEFELDKM